MVKRLPVINFQWLNNNSTYILSFNYSPLCYNAYKSNKSSKKMYTSPLYDYIIYYINFGGAGMGYTFLDLAREVLETSDKPLSVRQIWDRAVELKLDEKLGSGGKTPWATVGAQIYVDMKNREDSVWEKVIYKMIKMQGNWGYPNNPIFKSEIKERNAFIFDIDWTLAFMDWERSPYDYKKVHLDRPNEFLIYIMDKLRKDNDIIICSWRMDDCKAETIEWLKSHDIKYDKLYMRKEWDTRKDSIIKKEIYENEIKDKYNVIWVFDDRNQVVDMWRLVLWLPTYSVWYWNF